MKAYKYVVMVREDMVHGWDTPIKEVAIPSIGIIVNYSGIHFVGSEVAYDRVKGRIDEHEMEEFDYDNQLIADIAKELEAIKDSEEQIKESRKELQPSIDIFIEEFNLESKENAKLVDEALPFETGITTSHNVCTNFYEWKGAGNDEGED